MMFNKVNLCRMLGLDLARMIGQWRSSYYIRELPLLTGAGCQIPVAGPQHGGDRRGDVVDQSTAREERKRKRRSPISFPQYKGLKDKICRQIWYLVRIGLTTRITQSLFATTWVCFGVLKFLLKPNFASQDSNTRGYLEQV